MQDALNLLKERVPVSGQALPFLLEYFERFATDSDPYGNEVVLVPKQLLGAIALNASFNALPREYRGGMCGMGKPAMNGICGDPHCQCRPSLPGRVVRKPGVESPYLLVLAERDDTLMVFNLQNFSNEAISKSDVHILPATTHSVEEYHGNPNRDVADERWLLHPLKKDFTTQRIFKTSGLFFAEDTKSRIQRILPHSWKIHDEPSYEADKNRWAFECYETDGQTAHLGYLERLQYDHDRIQRFDTAEGVMQLVKWEIAALHPNTDVEIQTRHTSQRNTVVFFRHGKRISEPLDRISEIIAQVKELVATPRAQFAPRLLHYMQQMTVGRDPVAELVQGSNSP